MHVHVCAYSEGKWARRHVEAYVCVRAVVAKPTPTFDSPRVNVRVAKGIHIRIKTIQRVHGNAIPNALKSAVQLQLVPVETGSILAARTPTTDPTGSTRPTSHTGSRSRAGSTVVVHIVIVVHVIVDIIAVGRDHCAIQVLQSLSPPVNSSHEFGPQEECMSSIRQYFNRDQGAWIHAWRDT